MRAYLEYVAVVGDTDGPLLSPAEYEQYKRRVAEARAHRLYVAWRCTACGTDCHLVGPATRCFCGHAFKAHATDAPEAWRDRTAVRCRAHRCPCTFFEYVPVHGTFRIRCSCKHFFDEHSPATGPHRCMHAGCRCRAFYSPMSCSCGCLWDKHTTVFETREERIAAGRPVDNLGGGGDGFVALGGITSFSSLVDGAERQQQQPSSSSSLLPPLPSPPSQATVAAEAAAAAPISPSSARSTAEQRKREALLEANRLKQQRK